MSAGAFTSGWRSEGRGAFAPPVIAIVAVLGLLLAVQPELAFTGALLAGVAAAALVRPDVVVLIVVFALYLNGPATAVNNHGAPAMLAAVVPLLLAVPLAHHLLRGEKLRIDRTFVLILVLLIVQIVSTIFSEHQSVGVEKLKTITVEGMLLYLLILNAVRSRETLRHTMWMILLAAAALATITLIQKTTGNWSRPFGGFGQVQADYFAGKGAPARASGPLGDPNYYAQILLTALPLGLVLVWRAHSVLLRIAAAGACCLVLFAIMATNSRGAALGLLLILLTAVLLGMVRGRHLVPVIVALALLLSLVPEYKDRVLTLSSVGSATQEVGADPEADESTQSRAAEMLAATLVFRDHPVIGVGPGGFPMHYQEYARRFALPVHDEAKSARRKGEEAQRQAHNIFLSVAADLGLLGLVAFLGVLLSAALELIRGRKRAQKARSETADLAGAFLLAIVAYVTTGLFLTLAFERYFWLLLGLAGAAAAVARLEGRTADSSSAGPAPVPERRSGASSAARA